ncbi:hypothetical protein Saa2_08497 [Streptomyces acidiscabies]|nr:hypothetical protein Saa2_08497 [Streptomyces acidiscabies]
MLGWVRFVQRRAVSRRAVVGVVLAVGWGNPVRVGQGQEVVLVGDLGGEGGQLLGGEFGYGGADRAQDEELFVRRARVEDTAVGVDREILGT